MRKIADFVQKDGAAVGLLKPARIVTFRAGKGPLDIAENFRFHQGSGMAAQLIFTMGLSLRLPAE